VSEPQRIRVLVVDDSAFARKVLRQALEADERIQVVGLAADGLEALEKIATLAPDVITLDLVMPHLDGVGVLRALAQAPGAPRVVVVSFSSEESDLVVEALQNGAVEFVKKPTALATDRLYELSGELLAKVLAAAAARAPGASRAPSAALAAPARSSRYELLVIGTCTGGPRALTRLLAQLPADFPIPIAIALHIPEEYTSALARRLDGGCALHVVEAAEQQELRRGLVVLAKGGVHLRIEKRERRLFALIDRSGPGRLYVPSVDELFASAAQACGASVIGAVLTGMGNDGLAGARAIVAAGGVVLTEAESSCVIYGMPRCVREAGLSVEEAPLDDLLAALLLRLA
jgi:two-component system chemotaxis response regulator CheB